MSSGAILVLGGRSDIGLAIAKVYAREGHAVQLAARNVFDLEAEKADIALRYGVEVSLHEFDALDVESHEAFVTSLPALPETVVCAVGALGVQEESEQDHAEARIIMRSNFEGPVNILAILANAFEARGSGVIIGISSVAGDRGRATNYIYGAGKAGFTAYLAGMRNRLATKGVHVLTVKPGFVATRMTDGMDLPEKLTTDADTLARAVFKAAKRRRNEVYIKSIWWLVMLIIRNIPEFIFKKLKI
ncbi:MAG: SDR family oxidoreductase [Pseudomonadota bacterium]